MTDNITIVSNGLPNETHSTSTENAWEKKPKIVKPENIELQEKVMAKETVSHSGYVPAQLERHLEFMNFNTDGHAILGCSNLTGRFWIGSLWYYRNPSDAPSVEKSLTGVDFDNGLVEGFFLDNKTMIVALDNGGVETVKLSFSDEDTLENSFFYLERCRSVQEHDDLITSLVSSPDKLITCSYDRSVVVLEKESLKLVTKINEAHDDLISNMAVNPGNFDLIGTASNDGTVQLWDLRQCETSQSCIYDDVGLKPTCVQFVPSSEHHLLVGNEAGELQLFDIRKPKNCIVKNDMTEKAVSKIKFSPSLKNTFGVCSETSSLRVFTLDPTLSTLDIKYEDRRHQDFVRDLVWQPETPVKCFSCGWDHQVLTHTIPK